MSKNHKTTKRAMREEQISVNLCDNRTGEVITTMTCKRKHTGDQHFPFPYMTPRVEVALCLHFEACDVSALVFEQAGPHTWMTKPYEKRDRLVKLREGKAWFYFFWPAHITTPADIQELDKDAFVRMRETGLPVQVITLPDANELD